LATEPDPGLDRLLNLADPVPPVRPFSELAGAARRPSLERPAVLVAAMVVIALVAGVQLAALRSRIAPAASAVPTASVTAAPSLDTTAGTLGTCGCAGQLYLGGQHYDATTGNLTALPLPSGAPVDRAARAFGADDRYYFYGDLINLQTGTRMRVAPDARTSADVDPTGRTVAYINADGALVISRIDALGPDGSAPPLQNASLVGLRFNFVLWSPLGHKLLLNRIVTTDATHQISEPWVFDVAAGIARRIGSLSPLAAGAAGSIALQTLSFVSWSPDDRYVAGWLESMVGTGAQIDRAERTGMPLVVIDTDAGGQTELGTSLAPWTWMSWGPGDQLAYVSGNGDRWSDTSLKVWAGGRITTLNGGAPAISPHWSGNGKLFYITIPEPNALLAEYFGGQLAGGGTVVMLDPSINAAPKTLLGPDEYATEVLRASLLGDLLLVQRRLPSDLAGHPEIWMVPTDGPPARPLVRLAAFAWDKSTPPTFITPLLDNAAWSNSPAIRSIR
jgi:hypothetical protein